MSFGAILAVVINGMPDPQRLESRLVKGNRASEILDGYKDVVEHGFNDREPSSRRFPGMDRDSGTTSGSGGLLQRMLVIMD